VSGESYARLYTMSKYLSYCTFQCFSENPVQKLGPTQTQTKWMVNVYWWKNGTNCLYFTV